jgi:hypothetical protein
MVPCAVVIGLLLGQNAHDSNAAMQPKHNTNLELAFRLH